jgi:hypothetical protein
MREKESGFTDMQCMAYLYREFRRFMTSQPFCVGDIVKLPAGYHETEDGIFAVIEQADRACKNIPL